MKVIVVLRFSVAWLVLSCAAQQAQAVTNCVAVSGNTGFFGTMALQIAKITVPRDAPVGAILYTQRFEQAGKGLVLECDKSSGTLNVTYTLFGMKANTGVKVTFASGKIFETGVPGIGVVWYSGLVGVETVDTIEKKAPPISSGCASIGNGKCRTISQFVGGGLGKNATIVLIKTGTVGLGSIDGTALGQMVMGGSIDDSRSFSFSALGVTGNINIVASTCTTPDVSVQLGKQMLSISKGLGSGKGSSAPDVPFTISLTGCPGFPGLFNMFNNEATAASQSALTNVGILVKNTVSIRLDSTMTIDAAQGILSLTGPTSANGVGVQLLDEAGFPVKLSQSEALNPALLAASTAALNIKFSARYIQTANKVTPGVANAVATYTLMYQ